MKQKKRSRRSGLVALSLFLAIGASAVVSSCSPKNQEKEDNNKNQEVTLDHIAVTKQPTKTAYTVGEKFSRSGMVVTAYYSDETSKTIMGYSIDKTGALTLEDTTITITYEGKTTTVTITVTEKQVETQLTVTDSKHYTYKVEAETLPLSSDETGVDRSTYIENAANPATSGGQSLGNLNWSKNIIYFRVRSEVEVKADIVLAMSYNPSINYDEAVETKWNDTKVETGFVVAKDAAATYEWFDWHEYTIKGLSLKKGVNELSLRLVGDYSPNYDYVKLDVAPIDEEKVTGIEVTTAPTKTTYKSGEVFDSTGLVVSAVLEDKSKVEINDYTLNKGTLVYGDTSVLVTYKTWTVEIPVTVELAAVESLVVTAMPTRTQYYVGQPFNKSGLVITANYADGTSLNVTDVVTLDKTVISEGDTKVTATYGDKSVDIPITVLEKVHAKITSSASADYRIEAEDAVWIYDGTGNKTIYTVGTGEKYASASGGKALDGMDWLSGGYFMVMFDSDVATKAHLTVSCDQPGFDGLEARTSITWNGANVSLGSFAATGWNNYQPHQATEAIDVKKGLNVLVYKLNADQVCNLDYFELNVNPVTEIAASGSYATSYNEGDSFDTANLVVTASYLDGSSAPVTDYTVSPSTLTPDDTKVTITYKGKTIEIPVTVTAVTRVTSLTLDTTNVNLSYYAGQSFDTANLKVTANMSDGTSREIAAENYTLSQTVMEMGTTSVTVSYGGQSATITGITVQTHATINSETSKVRIELENALYDRNDPTSDKQSYKVVDDANASGGKRLDSLDWMNGGYFFVSLNNELTEDKTVSIVVRCSGGVAGGLDTVSSMTFNGSSLSYPTVNPTTDWSTWAEYTIATVSLRKGANTFTLHLTSNGSVNYDYVDFVINDAA